MSRYSKLLCFNKLLLFQQAVMTLECLGSLLETICNVGNGDGAETFERLPDCLVIDILSRLPPHSFLRCRWVCKHWRALVSSHDSFTNLHNLSTSTTPMLLIHDGCQFPKHEQLLLFYRQNKFKELRLIYRQNKFKKLHLRPELMINKHWLSLLYSCRGVLLFCSATWPSKYYVVNPITQEEVIVHHPLHPEKISGKICALYFCPYTSQFRILHAVYARGTSCQYWVYIFKTQRWRNVLSSTSFNHVPAASYDPPVVNGALHWITHQGKYRTPCEKGIMVFRMKEEKFSTMPHPGIKCNSMKAHQTMTGIKCNSMKAHQTMTGIKCNSMKAHQTMTGIKCNSMKAHQTMTLTVKDDCLFFCNLRIPHYTVDMWILKEYEMELWIKTHCIDLLDGRFFPFISRLERTQTSLIGVKLLYIQEGELLIYTQTNDEVYIYNLDHYRTVKKLKLPPKKSYSCALYYKSFLAIA